MKTLLSLIVLLSSATSMASTVTCIGQDTRVQTRFEISSRKLIPMSEIELSYNRKQIDIFVQKQEIAIERPTETQTVSYVFEVKKKQKVGGDTKLSKGATLMFTLSQPAVHVTDPQAFALHPQYKAELYQQNMLGTFKLIDRLNCSSN